MSGIIWLASYPKSGNTWMRAFLANLILGRGEPLPLQTIAGFIVGEALRRWYESMGVDPADDRAVARARETVQSRLAASSDKPIFLKTHNYLGEAHGHSLVNMEATHSAIYVVRNPLDVVISLRHHFAVSTDKAIEILDRESNNTLAADRLVFEKTADWSTHVKSWTQFENSRLLVVRYEDMLSSPLETFTNVVRFLDLVPPRTQLERAIENASFKTLQAQEEETGFSERPPHTERFFREGRTGQGQDELTDRQIRHIVDRHGEQMERYGYVPEGSVAESA